MTCVIAGLLLKRCQKSSHLSRNLRIPGQPLPFPLTLRREKSAMKFRWYKQTLGHSLVERIISFPKTSYNLSQHIMHASPAV